MNDKYYEDNVMTWDSQGNLITYFSKEGFAENKHQFLFSLNNLSLFIS